MSDTTVVGAVDDGTVRRARERAAGAQRVVVKAGTNSLTDEESRLDRVKLDKLVGDIMELRTRGKDVALVSSGAIGAGIGRLGRDVDSTTVEESQALSTVGQSQLMRHYTQSFDRYDQEVAQILLTEHDLANPERFTNVRNTVETLFEWDIVPIINENDAVATEEIQIGDNDMLSASVAIGVDVDLLVTLTDVGGIYTGNPKDDPDAELIGAVGTNYDAVQALVNDSTTAEFGGIQTKVEGARDVSEHGIPAIIAGSADRDVLERIATSKPVGTVFVPINGTPDD
jgi:glutamate 5-kinase